MTTRGVLVVLLGVIWFGFYGETPVAESAQPYCGDGVCEPAPCDEWQSIGDGCEEDVGPPVCTADCSEPWAPSNNCATEYPTGDIDWSENNPWQEAVGSCFGNCGAGCSDHFNPWCGPSDYCQHWELDLLTEPSWPIHGYQCWGSTQVNVTYDGHWAYGRWTYHGWEAVGCVIHDSYCAEWTFAGCAAFAGCGSGGPETWSYETAIWSFSSHDILTIESYEDDSPNCLDH